MVGDHEVAGAIPATQTNCFRSRHRSAERDTILRRSSAEVQLLPVALLDARIHSRGPYTPNTSLVRKVSLIRKSLLVRALGCVLENSASPSGTRLVSKTGPAAFDSLAAC